MRFAKKERITTETQIRAELNLDGTGKVNIETGIGMLNHLLELIAFWADFDLTMQCKGDYEIDAHHTIEDTGLVFGSIFLDALGDRFGIERIGLGRVPMDESLTDVTADISGRPWIVWRGDEILPPIIAGEEKDVWREFFKSFALSSRINLHISFLYGKNGHHLLESAAKGLGVALKSASNLNNDKLRSTKGELD